MRQCMYPKDQSRQQGAWEDYRRERDKLSNLLARSIQAAPQAHVIAQLPVHLDVNPRELLEKAEQVFTAHCAAVTAFTNDLNSATTGSYRELAAYGKVEQRYQELLKIAAELNQHRDFVESLT